jgi:hypothetical protein
MDVHLLSLAEWIAILQDADERERRRGQFLLGTIMDILQIAEGCKKGSGIEEDAFRAGWEAMRERAGLLEDGTVQLLGLDREELLDALFDHDRRHGEEGVSIWALVQRETRPWRTMRRLMLRPTEQRWWDQDTFDAMEEMFGEEPERHG